MTKITFCRTRHKYDPYIDFFRLVELAGFPIIYVDELDVTIPGVYIVSPHNGEWDPHIRNQDGRQRNAHLIHWNLERPSGSAGSVGKYGQRQRSLIYTRMFDEVWVSDRRLALETSLRYVPLGSHPELGQISNEKRYNLVHLSAEVPRRQTIYKYFAQHEIAPNCWPPERDKVLRLSKFGLATHQDDHPYCEPLRFALFAAYGLPILSETLVDAYPYSEDTMAFAEYGHLSSRMRKMIDQDYSKWREMGLRCRELMTGEFEFGKQVRLAVSQRVGDWR